MARGRQGLLRWIGLPGEAAAAAYISRDRATGGEAVPPACLPACRQAETQVRELTLALKVKLLDWPQVGDSSL